MALFFIKFSKKTPLMQTQEIAKHLVDYCRNGEFDTAQAELFADNAVSIEPYSTPEFEKETTGLKAIQAKGKKFEGMVEQVQA